MKTPNHGADAIEPTSTTIEQLWAPSWEIPDLSRREIPRRIEEALQDEG